MLRLVHAHSGYPVQGTDNAKAFLSGGPIEQAWIAEHAGQIVGHVAVSKATEDDVSVALWRKKHPEDPVAILERLFVHPEKLGGGIATRLIRTASSWGREAGCRLVLFALVKDQAAMRLYKRLGWTAFARLHSVAMFHFRVSESRLIMFPGRERKTFGRFPFYMKSSSSSLTAGSSITKTQPLINIPQKMTDANNKKKSIAVVGAGAAGLAAAKHLLGEGCRVTIFERKTGPGGVWNTAPGNGYWPSPVYEGLETNVPRTLMTFSDHPWDASVSLFPQSSQVNDYLHTYAAKLRGSYPDEQQVLKKQVLTFQYRTEVQKLRKGTHGMTAEWKIESKQYNLGQPPIVKSQAYAGIVVAIGNYHDVFMPDRPGFSEWRQMLPNTVLHSVDYRNPRDFTNMTVLVIGNSASGWDISSQLAATTARVTVSTRRFNPQVGNAQVSPGCEAAPAIDCFDPSTRSVRFVDGRILTGVDRLIYCTGYVYDLSFIKEGKGKKEQPLFDSGLKVKNVYKHMFYTQDPSLAFVGLPKMSAAFTVAEAQSAVIARVLSTRLAIPCMPFRVTWENEYNDEWIYQMQEGLATEEGYHSVQLSLDKDYVNELLAWSMSVGDSPESINAQPPPYWCECFDKARAESRSIRNAFQARGQRRHEITSLKSIGFTHLQAPCAAGLDRVYAEQHRCCSCFIFP
ncbi:hypothetical protein LTR36_000528 [Oleoguttula mirabilis]|uniref:N-acetyltransferase domain-containing protein n=1 Tax=Oleoguttula mirabilis TaxID=1507867 RepID=A0AAV9JPN7_9PEZI|nr:hypothetical protein LTR36_000528 [Oleoguttula mirabilis]